MSHQPSPLITILAIDKAHSRKRALAAKFLCSSLLRTMFTGRIAVLRNSPEPIFKIERKQVREKHITTPSPINDQHRIGIERELLFGILSHVDLSADEWLVPMDPFCMALRNIDHLLPQVCLGRYSLAPPDLLWVDPCNPPSGNQPSSPLFAVRATAAPSLLAAWKDEWENSPADANESSIWDSTLRKTEIRKAQFERGEIATGSDEQVHWGACARAALWASPPWTDDYSAKFQQALYYMNYYGDETGLFLHMTES